MMLHWHTALKSDLHTMMLQHTVALNDGKTVKTQKQPGSAKQRHITTTIMADASAAGACTLSRICSHYCAAYDSLLC
jgi:hypothetical protein